ncbi:MAG TPA: ATP-binding protein, partial [Psychrobacter sp.]|nr:ATP-binding protein [Psychrobacter sp.]
EEDTMRRIIEVHFPNIQEKLVNDALDIFYKLRNIQGLKKPPSTSELVDWLTLLLADDMAQNELEENLRGEKSIPPLYGALLKNEADVSLLQRFANMMRR